MKELAQLLLLASIIQRTSFLTSTVTMAVYLLNRKCKKNEKKLRTEVTSLQDHLQRVVSDCETLTDQLQIKVSNVFSGYDNFLHTLTRNLSQEEIDNCPQADILRNLDHYTQTLSETSDKNSSNNIDLYRKTLSDIFLRCSNRYISDSQQKFSESLLKCSTENIANSSLLEDIVYPAENNEHSQQNSHYTCTHETKVPQPPRSLQDKYDPCSWTVPKSPSGYPSESGEIYLQNFPPSPTKYSPENARSLNGSPSDYTHETDNQPPQTLPQGSLESLPGNVSQNLSSANCLLDNIGQCHNKHIEALETDSQENIGAQQTYPTEGSPQYSSIRPGIVQENIGYYTTGLPVSQSTYLSKDVCHYAQNLHGDSPALSDTDGQCYQNVPSSPLTQPAGNSSQFLENLSGNAGRCQLIPSEKLQQSGPQYLQNFPISPIKCSPARRVQFCGMNSPDQENTQSVYPLGNIHPYVPNLPESPSQYELGHVSGSLYKYQQRPSQSTPLNLTKTEARCSHNSSCSPSQYMYSPAHVVEVDRYIPSLIASPSKSQLEGSSHYPLK